MSTVPPPASRWLWITPEIRHELTTGALVYSMGLASAVAGAVDDGGRSVALTIVGVGPGANVVDGVEVVAVPGTLRGGWRSVLSMLPNLAYAAGISPMVDAVERLLGQRWDVVVIDGLQAAWATDVVQERHAGATVFVAHNHEATLRLGVARETPWFRPQRLALEWDAFKAKRLERRSARCADVVTSITDDDRDRFVHDAPDVTHVALTPGWSSHTAVAPQPISERPLRAGILGSFEWHVKQENLRRFLTVADPIFADAGVELVVGGKTPQSFLDEVVPSLVATRFVGWVDDPAEFLGSCRVGVVAEPLGGGFKLKSLEYVFNSVPIACLAGNAVGLPLVAGVSMIEAATLPELARAIASQLGDAALLEGLAEAAIAASSQAFAWSTRGEQLVRAVAATDTLDG